jgi:hypothetical protein
MFIAYFRRFSEIRNSTKFFTCIHFERGSGVAMRRTFFLSPNRLPSTGSMLYEVPYLWKSVGNEVVSPGGLVGANPTHLQLFSPETTGECAQGSSPWIRKNSVAELKMVNNIYPNVHTYIHTIHAFSFLRDTRVLPKFSYEKYTADVTGDKPIAV